MALVVSFCVTGPEFGPNRSVMLPIESVVKALQRKHSKQTTYMEWSNGPTGALLLPGYLC
jgi:hypothetical protein